MNTPMFDKSYNFLQRLAGRSILRLPIQAATQAAAISRMRTGRYIIASQVCRSIVIETDMLRHYCYLPLPRKFVVPGDWDREQQPILPNLLECPHFSFVYEVYEEGRNYKDTKHYRKIIAELDERGCAERGIRAIDEAHAYFERTMRMIDEIREGRYRTQSELGGRPSDEIRVSVSRNGGLLKYHNGSHRLAAAILYNIPRIPVYVMFVHEACFRNWCEQYDQMNAVEVLSAGIGALDCSGAAEGDVRDSAPSYAGKVSASA